jgi:hypothetical protein
VTTIVNQRVLPGLENQLNGCLVVVSNSLFDDNCEVRLGLIAPSMKEQDLRVLREGLCERFNATADSDWLYGAKIKPHFETGDPEVVVTINDPSLLGHQSVDLILGLARAFVAPTAAQHWCSNICTLKGTQRLVPLAFDRPLSTTAMSVTLPKPLALRTPRRYAARQLTEKILNGTDSSAAAGRAYLQAALELAFDNVDWIDNVVVGSSYQGTSVAVNFDYRFETTPFRVNTTQAVIMEVLKQHVVPPQGVYDDLVFVSTTPAGEDEDDEY